MIASATFYIIATGSDCSLLTGLAPNGEGTDGVSYEMGMKFQARVPGRVTQVRYYRAARETGARTATLWNMDGTVLSSAAFVNETASGWQEAILPTPVRLQVGTPYIVTVNCNSFYAYSSAGLATQISNPELTSVVGNNGVFGAVGSLPTGSYNDANYFCDIIFVAD